MGFRINTVEVDLKLKCIRRDGETIQPRAKTFELFVYLLDHRDRLVTKEELLANIWRHASVTDDSLVQCVLELRKTLGDDARRPRFIKTVPKCGYQIVGEVEETEAPAATPVVELERVTTCQVEYREEISDEKAPVLRKAWVVWALAAIVGLIACVAVFAGWREIRSSEADSSRNPGATQRAVAVMYFENQSASADLDWLRQGLADMLITSLSRSQITVLGRHELDGILRRSRDAGDRAIRLADALRIAEQTHSSAVTLGTFDKLGNGIRVSVELHDAGSGRLLSTESFISDQPARVLDQIDMLALKLASTLGSAPAAQSRTGLTTLTNNLEAYRNYYLGIDQADALHGKAAIALFERALTLDPEFAMAQARIGDTYSAALNSPEAGKPYLEKAFRLSSRLTDSDRLSIVAWYAEANLDYPQAIRALRELISKVPADIAAYNRLGSLLTGERRYGEAVAVLNQALVVNPESAHTANELAHAYAFMNRMPESIEAALRYVDLAPREPNAYDTLGEEYQQAGRFQQAEQTYRKALEIQNDFEIAQIHLANNYYQQGQYRAAIREFERYIRIAPSDEERVRGYASLAWIYRRLRDPARAQDAAAEQLRLTAIRRAKVSIGSTDRGKRRSNRVELYLRAQQAVERNQPGEAIALFQAAVRERAPIWHLDFLEDCLGDAYLNLGRMDDAIAEYQRVLQVFPGTALARYHLAVSYERVGQRNRAQEEYRRFLQMWNDADPDIPELAAARSASK